MDKIALIKLAKTVVIGQLGIVLVLCVQVYYVFLEVSKKRTRVLKLYKHVIYSCISQILSSIFIAIVVARSQWPDSLFYMIFGMITFIIGEIGMYQVWRRLKDEMPFIR